MSRSFWLVPREWPGETVFIIAGGPSVRSQNLELLRGRRVIVINSSVYAAPWADILYFGDWRWWNEPANDAAVRQFAGRVVTVSVLNVDPKVLVCRKAKPPGLAISRDSLAQNCTSLTAATNLAAHLIGPGGTIVWLGADGGKAPDGRTHHHRPHRWAYNANAPASHHAELATIVPMLRELDIAAFNASPGTNWFGLLPVINLVDMIEPCRAAS